MLNKKHKIIISDRSFNVLEELQDDAVNVQWDFNRIGGCGGFSFDVPRKYCTDLTLGGDFNVKIYYRNPTTKAFDLRYQGRMPHKTYNVRGDGESISLQGLGYQSQLGNIYVDRNYTNKTVEYIVKDILDNDITPNTNITYSVGDIAATGVTLDSMPFNTDALKAMETLAGTVGSREWGVGADRKFYFKARSSSVGFRFPVSGKVINYTDEINTDEVINRIIITGGDVSGSPFTQTFDYAASQLKWGRRDKPKQNSSIITSSVAQKFADALNAEYDDAIHSARLEIIDDTMIESTIPIPLVQLLPRQVAYGEKYYGTFLYSGRVNYQVNRVNYRIDDSGVMRTNIQLGQLRPQISEDISQLSYQIEQLRNQGL